MAEAPETEQDENRSVDLAAVLLEEHRYIYDYRKSAPLEGRPEMFEAPSGKTLQDCQKALYKSGVAALCLSGGGIRSATFSLGVIQGLAKLGLLRRFDYLSTVSGGGYIGSWLSSWAFRAGGLEPVEKVLQTQAEPIFAASKDDVPTPLQWLRNYSSYLAPKAGLFSIDTWTLIATYVRNLLIVWMALVPPLMLVLFLPRLLYHGLLSDDYGEDTVEFLTLKLAVASLFWLSVGEWNSYRLGNRKDQRDTPMTYAALVNVPYTIGAFLLGLAWVVSPAIHSWWDIVPRTVLGWIFLATVIGIGSEWRLPKERSLHSLWELNRWDIIAC